MFYDVYLADVYSDQRGVGVHLDITVGNVVSVDGRSKGDNRDPDHTINALIAAKAKKQYTSFPDKQVKTLAMNSGGRMSPDFHQVLYAFARRKATAVFGPENVSACDAEGTRSNVAGCCHM